MTDLDLQKKINSGEIDCNNQNLFFSTLLKGLIFNLNKTIKIRDKYVPHYILNTGTDIMYLEKKGQDHSKEPHEVSNENFIYTITPRALVSPGGIELLEDQLTSPYTRGNFDMEYEGSLYSFNAEYRRMPLKMTVELKYTFDTFTDVLNAAQQIITKFAFIQNFNIDYMGQTIFSTYRIPSSIDHEENVTFDGVSTDSKNRTMTISLEVETNIPVFEGRTAILNSNFIRKTVGGMSFMKNGEHIGGEEVYDPDGALERYIKWLAEIAKEAHRAKNILNELLIVEGKKPQKTIYKSAEKVIDLQAEVVSIMKELNGIWNQVSNG